MFINKLSTGRWKNRQNKPYFELVRLNRASKEGIAKIVQILRFDKNDRGWSAFVFKRVVSVVRM